MRSKKIFTLSFILIFLLSSSILFGSDYLNSLTKDQSINGFKTVSVYNNGNGNPIGARFVSEKYGFILDYLQIESVPQAFFWVKTPPTSSKGEPHACEHLLLGKGNRGRYVAALEDMALSNSTAYTAQTRTCYHFNTVADENTFYKIFEAKLQALLHPNFTDEEIRREVCHIGVTENPETGELSIDEKGTVYTEMVSSFEKPWYYTYSALNNMVYGKNHPLTNNSGGNPDVMRTMVPEDMWTFHKETHHLSNMGAIVSLPSSVPVDQFLKEMDQLLNRCQDYKEDFAVQKIKVTDFPPIHPSPEGSMKMVTYPSEKDSDPGDLLYAYPAQLKLDYKDKMILDLFLSVFANGSTSNLYNLFINSETKQIDIGGSYVYGGYDDDIDVSLYFGLSDVDNKNVTKENLLKVKDMVVAEADRIANFADGSEDLKAFNGRVLNQLSQEKKQLDKMLNSPPMFGFRRGTAGRWVSLLLNVEDQERFAKSLTFNKEYKEIEDLLKSDKNIWRDYIAKWKITTTKPYMVGAKPDPAILVKNAEDKKLRIADYTTDFEKKYNTEDVQFAYAKYKEDFDAKTAELDKQKAFDKLPDFVKNPPMTLDDQLKYETLYLSGNIPLVASTFENMTSGEVGLALNMNVVPQSHFVYLPIIPDVLTEIGVVKDGTPVPYDQMREQLRKEILGLHAYYNIDLDQEMVELIISGEGNNREELTKAISWMESSLFSPYLEEANLPRLRDVVNQSLNSLRNRMKGSEEGWVNNPANAYRLQHNPLFLSTSSFLTETNLVQRLKWMLTDAGDENDMTVLSSTLDKIESDGIGKNRAELEAMLKEIESNPLVVSSDISEKVQSIVKELAKDMNLTLADIPDENLSGDWSYLCQLAKSDIESSPRNVLNGINDIMSLLRKSDIARMYIVSNSADRMDAMNKLELLVSKLDSSPSKTQTYMNNDYITSRLRSRIPELTRPVYTGLVFNGTRNGVLIFNAPNTSEYDTNEDALLKGLSGKLYTGYGPHGLFMRTWAAGLAYSNGYRFSERSGRARYYAERCPDVAETMRFVVSVLKDAEDDPQLVDYAVAQVFGDSRAPSRYESRGAAMAEDLATGFTPDRVKNYREAVLEMTNDPDLYNKIKAKMEDAYGSVMIGYGKNLSEVEGGIYFLIGPEEQFESLEQLIKQTEGEQTVYRLYPRDFWIVNN